jgi:cell division transport system permease protein
MAIKVSYVVKESVGNLRRNLLMTAAALITVTISLALAGASLLFRNGIDNAYIQFKNGFDITVMMKADASQEQIDGIGAELRSNPQIDQKAKKPRFVTKEESYAEIQRMFQNAPETLSAFRGVEDAPAQWRFKPVDAEQLEILGQRFQKRAGVLSVSYAKSAKLIRSVAQRIQLIVLCIAGALLLSAVILILNTVRMAIFARRREVAVMKLVGATNGFIRLPFMVEGLLQGLLGSIAGFGLVAIGTKFAQSSLRHSNVPIARTIAVSSTQLLSTGIFMLIVGALVGALGSAVAVSRFLDV